MTSVLLAVGDSSGDRYAADLVRELRLRLPELRFLALGGAMLEKAGVELVVHQRSLAVGGVVELAPHLWGIAQAWRAMVRALATRRPDLLVLVDSAGFNLPLARRARRAGVPVLYYVAPQVWAWRRGRIRKLAARVDRVATILPFEPAVYEGSGLQVEFVGHPLVDHLREAVAATDRAEARRALRVDPEEQVVAVLPGSRTTELRHCLGVHLETARVLHARDPRIRFLLPLAPSIPREVVAGRVHEARLPALLRLELTDDSLQALIACDAVLAKPGTATLEATLLGRPLVIAARGNPLTAAIVRRLVAVEHLGMPNLIAGETIVPEFLQREAEPQRIADAVLALLAGPARDRQLARLAEVRARLGAGGAARRVAAIAEEMLAARGRP